MCVGAMGYNNSFGDHNTGNMNGAGEGCFNIASLAGGVC